MCTEFVGSAGGNKENGGSETIGLFESPIVADLSVSEWPPGPTICTSLKEASDLLQQNDDLKDKNKDLTERLQALEVKLLSTEKKHLEREMDLLTELRQGQKATSDPETDPKDVLITSLRHQVISLRSANKSFERKIERLLKGLPVDEVCKFTDIWEEEDIGDKEESFSGYSDVLREAYSDLTENSTVFYLKSRLLQ